MSPVRKGGRKNKTEKINEVEKEKKKMSGIGSFVLRRIGEVRTDRMVRQRSERR